MSATSKNAQNLQRENSAIRKKVWREKSGTWKQNNKENVKHQMNATQKKCYSKIVQNEKSATQKVYKTKKDNLKRVKYENFATQNGYDTKEVQHKVSATWSKTEEGAAWKKCNN